VAGIKILAAAFEIHFSFNLKRHHMRLLLLIFLMTQLGSAAFAQKMLILERANRAKTTKMYIGESLNYRMKGAEDYWYQSTITDILPETKTLLLDNFPVKVDSIAEIKVRRSGLTRIIGGALVTFGASLAFANTIAILYRDKNTPFLAYYGVAVGSFGAGSLLLTRKKLKLGKKHRLRIIEIKFLR
jgi:hypothetical protein